MSQIHSQGLTSPCVAGDFHQDELQATETVELSLQQLEQTHGGAGSPLNSAQAQLLAWLKATQPTTFCGWKVPAGFKW